MAIRYIHNDPCCVPFLESTVSPQAARQGSVAKFSLSGLPAEQVYSVDSVEFVDWQCRDVALRTIAIWEEISSPLRFWHNRRRSIDIKPRGADTIEAKYDRRAITFGQWPASAPSVYVGASADAVSHEVGHAILDSIRPRLWDSLRPEVAAFHEGFADCISLLVALFDAPVVQTLFQGVAPQDALRGVDSPVAQVAESVAASIHQAFGSQHPASLPRRLKNQLRWAISTTLPPNPTPTNLSREPHSFGRVFSGCFYDCVDNIYRLGTQHNAKGLQKAAQTAGELLAKAVATAPEEVRFFRAIGRAMIQADNELNDGQNHLAIRNAFTAHNVALGSSMQLAPNSVLHGLMPSFLRRNSHGLSSHMRADLLRRAGAPSNARVSAEVMTMANKKLLRANVSSRMEIHIPGNRKQRTVVRVNDEVLIAKEKNNGVLLGELPNRINTEEEIDAFVLSLVESDALDTAGHKGTHKIVRRGKQHELRRARFSCIPTVWAL